MTPQPEPSAPAGEVRRLADGVFAWVASAGGWGSANTALVSGHGSSLLVDTLWDLRRTSAMLAGFRRQLEESPVSRVVNTHADGDHWFGNQLAGDAEILATESAAKAMRRHGPAQMRLLSRLPAALRLLTLAPMPNRTAWRRAGPYIRRMLATADFSTIRPVPATRTVAGTVNLEVGGRPVRLVELGPAHTAGDLVVYLPDDRILVAGDVLFAGTIPLLWDGSSRNWVRACETLLKWEIDVAVPGHGLVTDRAGIETLRKYWQVMRSGCRRFFERSVPPLEAAIRILDSNEYTRESFAGWDGQERTAMNCFAIYRRLLGRRQRMGTLDRLRMIRDAASLEWLLSQRVRSSGSSTS